MLLLSRSDIEAALDLDELRDAVEAAMVELSSGTAAVAPRTGVGVAASGGWLAAMAASLPSQRTVAAKLVTVFPNPPESGIPTHQAVITLFDDATGTPAAILDGTYITAVRTAAGSAVATKWMARIESRRLVIVGTGVQAREHARAVARVRPIEEIVIAGRSEDSARRLAAEVHANQGIATRATTAIAEAVASADIVCAATHALEPVVQRASVRPGTHITSVGVNREGREVDAQTVADAHVVVEQRDAALAGSGAAGANDLTWAIRDGVISDGHIAAELGAVIAGRATGRSSAEQITLYKSVGVAVQDAAAAALAVTRARSLGLGVDVSL